jgi:hypothetical protein
MNTTLEYSTRVVQEGGRRCKKSTLNDLVHLTPLMNPPIATNTYDHRGEKGRWETAKQRESFCPTSWRVRTQQFFWLV